MNRVSTLHVQIVATDPLMANVSAWQGALLKVSDWRRQQSINERYIVVACTDRARTAYDNLDIRRASLCTGAVVSVYPGLVHATWGGNEC